MRKTYKSYYLGFITINCIAILSALLSPSNSFASNKDTITTINVHVVDSANNSPIAFATVTLYAENTTLTYSNTDTNGIAIFSDLGGYNVSQLSIKVVDIFHKDKVVKNLSEIVIVKMQEKKNLPIIGLGTYTRPVVAETTSSLISTISKIKGTVVDSSDHETICFAAVALMHNDSIIGTATTDLDGQFTIEYNNVYKLNELTLKVVELSHKDKTITNLRSKMTIALKLSGKIIIDYIIFSPPAIDQTGHVNTRIRKGDTPYW